MFNEYQPFPATIEKIKDETYDTKTFTLRFADDDVQTDFAYRQGQFMEVSVLGYGEVPISITSSPSRKGVLELCIRAAGKVTRQIHTLQPQDILHLRGPYGNTFPYEELKGKNIYFITGGIGLAPVRSLMNLVFDHKSEFGKVKVLYGARTPQDICFREELEDWKKINDTEVFLTVDRPCDDWCGCTGVITELWKETEITAENAVAVVCGPPIMIKFVAMKLNQSGFTDRDIIITLERHMKCGIGKCGHCNCGDKFICTDGPVFSYDEVKKMPLKEYIF